MAKFIRMLLKNVPKKGDVEQWRLVIDNVEELKKYHSFDAKANAQAFMAMKTDDDGRLKLDHVGVVPSRQQSLLRLLNCHIDCAQEDEKIYPILEVGKITSLKFQGMLKCIIGAGAIQINEVGAYSDLNGFIKIWDAEVLETIHKEDFAFPVSMEAMKCDTLILENAFSEDWSDWKSTVKKKVPNHGTIQTIYNLKEVDMKWVFKCIQNCKNIFASTQATDIEQVDAFISAFMKVDRKNIYIYVDSKAEKSINSRPNFKEASQKHNIQFIYSPW